MTVSRHSSNVRNWQSSERSLPKLRSAHQGPSAARAGFGFANWMPAKTTIANVMRSIFDLFGFQRTNNSRSVINSVERVACGGRAAWASALPTGGSDYRSRDYRPGPLADTLQRPILAVLIDCALGHRNKCTPGALL